MLAVPLVCGVEGRESMAVPFRLAMHMNVRLVRGNNISVIYSMRCTIRGIQGKNGLTHIEKEFIFPILG